MKRFILSAALLLSMGLAFANVEMSIAFSGSVFDKSEFDVIKSPDLGMKNVTGTIETGTTLGIAQEFGFYGNVENKKLEIGFAVFDGVSWIDRPECKLSVYDLQFYSARGSGSEWYLGFGVAARYTPSSNLSFYVRPGLMGTVRTYSYESSSTYCETFYDRNIMFDCKAGIKYWTTNSPGYHFGIDAGFEYGAMINSKVGEGTMESISYDYDISSRKSGKIYVGICFNFGDRGCDQ